MALCERDIDVAAFADRLAVIKRFENCKQACVLLHQARDGIDVAGTPCATQCGPFPLGLACRGDGGIDIVLACLAQRCQGLAICRVLAVKPVSRGGELPIDEVAKTGPLVDQPRQSVGSTFRSGAIVHRFKDLFYGHRVYCPVWNDRTKTVR